MRNFVLCGVILLATSAQALAKPAASDWMAKAAVFTNADVLNARGGALSAGILAVIPETLDPASVVVTLVDRQGLTQVEVVCNASGIYELQNGSEFTRRSALGGIHAAVLAAITGKTGGDGASKGGGVFGRIEAPPSAGEKMISEFIKSREAEDVVISLGWIQKDGAQEYGTVYSDRIELNPDAPKAPKK